MNNQRNRYFMNCNEDFGAIGWIYLHKQGLGDGPEEIEVYEEFSNFHGTETHPKTDLVEITEREYNYLEDLNSTGEKSDAVAEIAEFIIKTRDPLIIRKPKNDGEIK